MQKQKRPAKYSVEPIAEFIQVVLEQCSLSPNAFSRAAQIPDSTVYDLLAIKINKPSFELMQEIALNLSLVSGMTITLDIFDQLSRKTLSLEQALNRAQPSPPEDRDKLGVESVPANPGVPVVEPAPSRGPSKLVVLIRHILETEKLSRQAFATREALELSRLDAILDRDAEPTAEEYETLARALNRLQYRDPQWDAETLEWFYHRKMGELNGDPIDNNS